MLFVLGLIDFKNSMHFYTQDFSQISLIYDNFLDVSEILKHKSFDFLQKSRLFMFLFFKQRCLYIGIYFFKVCWLQNCFE